jgi:hypothetical protein
MIAEDGIDKIKMGRVCFRAVGFRGNNRFITNMLRCFITISNRLRDSITRFRFLTRLV